MGAWYSYVPGHPGQYLYFPGVDQDVLSGFQRSPLFKGMATNWLTPASSCVVQDVLEHMNTMPSQISIRVLMPMHITQCMAASMPGTTKPPIT